MNEQLSPLKRALLTIETLQDRLHALESERAERIAVIGIGCRLPGGVDSPTAFARLLADGRDAIRLAPPTARPGWDAGDVSAPPAGYLESDPGEFDAGLFGISPREAASIDPQQRIALECAWEALENAGIAHTRLVNSSTGVFMGITGSDYAQTQLRAGNRRELIHAHFASGIAPSMLSGRIAYLFGLQGPAVSLDTACSSSLVAVHLACESLRSRETDLALAGGTSLILGTDLTTAFLESRMLSPDGRCKTFDARADGFGRGEGCGVLALKRLGDAVRDGDPIWAVVRGSAINQDGPSSGLTAPNGPSQESVIRAALRRTGLEPRDVGYVEAHGTGTELGDPIEVQALGSVYGSGRADGPLLIGTVKTNLGHLEGAAGVAGLIKAILAVHSGEIPRHLNFADPNPLIPWDRLPVRVTSEPTPFPAAPDGSRRAGTSSFGFSGTNAHVIVEQAPAVAAADSLLPPRNIQVLPLSARTPEAVRALAGRYADALETGRVGLAELCHTACVGRASLPQRLAVVCGSANEAVSALRAYAAAETGARGIRHGRAPVDAPRPVFLFTGQGSQWPGMGRELYDEEPVFRAVIEQCDALARESCEISLLDTMLGRSRDARATLARTRFAQPALFALEVALAELWRSWGLRPAMVIGHSVGEYAAAVVAGAISLEQAFALICERGRLMDGLPEGGSMASVAAGESAVAACLDGERGRVSIAAINGPASVVISGDGDAVERVRDALAAAHIDSTPLPVSHAFHSHRVEPVLEKLKQAAAGLDVAEPRVPLISNRTGRPIGRAELADPEYWAGHAREPVLFDASLRYACGRGHAVFVECGPTPTLCALGAEAMTGADVAWISSLRRGQSDSEQIGLAAAALFVAGIELDHEARDRRRAVRRARIPTYPFQREPLWVRLARPEAGVSSPARRRQPHPLLGDRVLTPDQAWRWERVLARDTLPYLADHVVNGQVIVPAAAYIEAALAAAAAGPGWRRPRLTNMTIRAPLVLSGSPRAVHVVIDEAQPKSARISISSIGEDEQQYVQHVSADLQPGHSRDVDEPGLDRGAITQRCTLALDTEEFYALLSELGLAFGPAFRGVRSVRYGDGEAFGEIALPAEHASERSRYAVHPALLDAGLQVAVAALRGRAEAHGAAPGLYLPITAERVTRGSAAGSPCASHVRLEESRQGSETLTASVRIEDEAGDLVIAVERLVMKRASARFGALRQPVQAVYEIEWMQAESGGSVQSVPRLGVRNLAERLGSAVPSLSDPAGLALYDHLYADLEQLSTSYVIACFAALGWRPEVGASVSAVELAGELDVLPRHHRLLHRMLTMLAEDGLADRDGDRFRLLARLPTVDTVPVAEDMGSRYGEDVPELDVTIRCGERLASVLTGAEDPLALLFPGGDTSILSRLYRDTPLAHGLNSLMRRGVEMLVGSLPEGQRLRVLEIGGGTGGTTAHVLPILPDGRAEYTFTDIGPTFVSRARAEFGQRPGTRFETLDIDLDPADQGFTEGEFDVVLASNVLHATKDVNGALERVKRLLAPGGVLFALEAVRPERWHDVTVGMLEGWWAFTDTELRPEYALLDRDRWLACLGEHGFDAAATCAGSPESVIARQTVLVAQKTAEAARVDARAADWLVVADRCRVTDAIIAQLTRHGARLVRIDAPAADTPEARTSIEGAVRNAEAAPTDIVYCPAPDLDGSDLEGCSSVGLENELSGACAGALYLAQESARIGDNPPRLHIVTRGATPAGGHTEPVRAAQATLWGLARAVRAERPEIPVRVIDLPVEPSGDDLERLGDELLGSGAEPELALRHSQRLVPRLVPRNVAVPAEAREPVRLAFGESGVLDELEFVPHPRVAPGKGEVEIEIEAAGLNFRDVMHALGMQYVGTRLGGECVGIVAALGDGVEHVRVGDRVLAAAGAFGDYVTVHSGLVARVPKTFSIAAAATVPIAFLTADYALSEIGGMRSGETVLIHAAAGGVGMAAVQLAKAAGLRVLGTAGTPRKRALARELGAEAVFDSRSLEFADDVLGATGGRGVDLVLNSLAGDFIPASLRALARGGRLLELGKTGIWTQQQVDACPGLEADIRYHAIDLSPLIERDPEQIRARLGTLVARFESGELRPLPHRVVPMSRAVDAFRDMAAARHVGKLVLARETTLPVRVDGTYLVTGGLSGLGLLVAARLAERGAGHLLLVGRTEPGAASVQTIESLRAGGTEVDVVLADVSRRDELARVLSRPGLAERPLRGVVHSAGTLSDAMLPEQTWAHFRRVFGAKVLGSAALAELTAGAPLDFFVLFSSISSVLGASGQANHSAANAFMDALAAGLTASGRPTLSIAWGAWTGTGAAVRHGTVERVSQRGVLQIHPEHGLELFESLAACTTGAVVASPMDWRVFMDSLGRRNPLIEHLAPGDVQAGGRREEAVEAPGAGTIAEALASASPRRRARVLRRGVERCVARILGLPAGRVPDGREPLGEIGLDSLLAVELRNALATEIGEPLPATLLFDFPTVDALTEHLATRLQVQGPSDDGPVGTGDMRAAQEPLRSESLSVLDFIEGLSDSEVAARVNRQAGPDDE